MCSEVQFPEEPLNLDPGLFARAVSGGVPRGAAPDAGLQGALEALALGLAMIRRCLDLADLPELSERAEALAVVARQVRLAEVSRIALDVAACADRRDMPALGATVARLSRVGENALAALWNA